MNEKESVKEAVAGGLALVLTAFAAAWIVLLFFATPPMSRAPLWFRGAFWVAGVLLATLTFSQWRERVRGGRARLLLPMDPIPIGVPLDVQIELDKLAHDGDWSARLEVTRQRRKDDDPRRLWGHELKARRAGQRVTATLFIPEHLPPTNGNAVDSSVGCELLLKGPFAQWRFAIATRPATHAEMERRTPPPRELSIDTQEATLHRRSRGVRWIIAAGVLVQLLLLGMFLPASVRDRLFGLFTSGYATAVTTERFPVSISSWHEDNRNIQAQLDGTAQITASTLTLHVEQLSLRGFPHCGRQTECDVKRVQLLLARERDGYFETLAAGMPIEVGIRLQDDQVGTLRDFDVYMSLPPKLDRDDTLLKLQVVFADDASTYIDAPRLLLQRALAKQTNATDPCERLRDPLEAIRSGCSDSDPDLDPTR